MGDFTTNMNKNINHTRISRFALLKKKLESARNIAINKDGYRNHRLGPDGLRLAVAREIGAGLQVCQR